MSNLSDNSGKGGKFVKNSFINNFVLELKSNPLVGYKVIESESDGQESSSPESKIGLELRSPSKIFELPENYRTHEQKLPHLFRKQYEYVNEMNRMMEALKGMYDHIYLRQLNFKQIKYYNEKSAENFGELEYDLLSARIGRKGYTKNQSVLHTSLLFAKLFEFSRYRSLSLSFNHRVLADIEYVATVETTSTEFEPAQPVVVLFNNALKNHMASFKYLSKLIPIQYAMKSRATKWMEGKTVRKDVQKEYMEISYGIDVLAENIGELGIDFDFFHSDLEKSDYLKMLDETQNFLISRGIQNNDLLKAKTAYNLGVMIYEVSKKIVDSGILDKMQTGNLEKRLIHSVQKTLEDLLALEIYRQKYLIGRDI